MAPTVTGVLVATEQPRPWLPNAFIQAVAYRGTSTVPERPSDLYQLDSKDISGPADAQVIEACRFVLRNMRVAATKGPGRRDLPQFDMGAVFEAVVNAVAHRDYSIHGSKIRLRLFADRLELYSPGALPNTLDIDSLPFRQAARNETLTSMLARCPFPDGLDWLKTDRQTLMDKRGEGVRIILDNSKRLSGRSPVYRLIDESELLLTIHAAMVLEVGAMVDSRVVHSHWHPIIAPLRRLLPQLRSFAAGRPFGCEAWLIGHCLKSRCPNPWWSYRTGAFAGRRRTARTGQ